MRDIVSYTGTFFGGLTALQLVSGTQTSPAVALTGYDGAQVYIICSACAAAATLTPVLQVTNDNGSGVASSGNWTAVANADLVLWTATSASNFAPTFVGNQQPTELTNAVVLNQRVGYIGAGYFTTGGGVTLPADWLRVVSTYGGSGNVTVDIVIHLGRPRLMPAPV